MKQILVIDDEPGVRESLKFSLQDTYRVHLAGTGGEGLELARRVMPDLVILDIVMPDKNGVEILKEIKRLNHDTAIIMLTAVSQVRTAVEAMKLGAADYLTKPYDVEELRLVIDHILQGRQMQANLSLLREELGKEYPVGQVIFRSPAMQEVLEKAVKIAATNSTALLLGPTGVGKELVARFIHAHSSRREEPFVPIHCAAIPETLFESELFGYEKGAFTNATQRKAGKIELAGSGTIFLDEVSEIPLALQVKLLRFLENKEFARLGGNETIRSEGRILSASARNLKTECAAGRFREDLYYRLGVVPLEILPLRERREDIRPLVNYYFGYFRNQLGCRAEGFSSQALDLLDNYDWPGNVRELRNIVERILVLKGNQAIIEDTDLPGEIVADRPPEVAPFKEAVEQYEKKLIQAALKQADGNQSKAAALLQTTRRIVRYKAEKYNLVTRNEERKNTDS